MAFSSRAFSAFSKYLSAIFSTRRFRFSDARYFLRAKSMRRRIRATPVFSNQHFRDEPNRN
ncbi:MAG: hypothetical protein ACRD37_12430, partial [Candidatus Acidiferrales bacterium]